ncbi:MAG: cadherin-like domain-containing protein [Pseudomonadota bacterium]
MPEMKAPGVYIVEKDAFPNSVVQVATAVPAFIGHTEMAKDGTETLADTPRRLTSMAEYTRYFGGAPNPIFALRKAQDDIDQQPDMPKAQFTLGTSGYEVIQTGPAYMLYAAMRLFFLNGGGACYVTSIGSYDEPFAAEKFHAAITGLKKEQEPTLVVIPEAVRLPRAQATRVQSAMLAHCGEMRNRFAILDVPGGFADISDPRGNPVAGFRKNIGTDHLSRGAAYYPWLNTTVFDDRELTFGNLDLASRETLATLLKASTPDAGTAPEVNKLGMPQVAGDFTIVAPKGGTVILTTDDISASDGSSTADELRFDVLDASAPPGGFVDTTTKTEITTFTQADLADGKVSFTHYEKAGDHGEIALTVTDKDGFVTGAITLTVVSEGGLDQLPPDQSLEEDDANLDKTLRAIAPGYVAVVNAMTACCNTLPPSSAMAGIYTLVDNTRGVWKAPANVSIASVLSPSLVVSHDDQQDLNMPITGTSINAIRPFVGKGTLVWGARTLDGNSVDWRYINVRRTMIMLETSIRLAAKAYMFEPNTATTWITLQSMIENFLIDIWKQGGLAGSVPEDAFSVHVGLGETMTQADILDGRLRITVLVAVIRPAEFIEITFQQQMQKS